MSEYTAYDGWENYETWVCNQRFVNDESMYNELQHILSVDRDIVEHAMILKNIWRDKLCYMNLNPSLFLDLLNAGIERIDWYNIVKEHLE